MTCKLDISSLTNYQRQDLEYFGHCPDCCGDFVVVVQWANGIYYNWRGATYDRAIGRAWQGISKWIDAYTPNFAKLPCKIWLERPNQSDFIREFDLFVEIKAVNLPPYFYNY